MTDIKIEYDGSYPNLCSGDLSVIVDGKKWDFPPNCLCSGGNVWFTDDWDERVEEGKWTVSEWPDDFPENMKSMVMDAVNEQVGHGCCGGCI